MGLEEEASGMTCLRMSDLGVEEKRASCEGSGVVWL